MIRALVLRTAGTNCERETCRALELAGAEVDLLHLNRLIEEPASLAEHSVLVIPGGFSYGDDVAAGRVLGLELRHHLGEALRGFVDGGGFVLGICNGFQVLVETGLLETGSPEDAGAERSFALYGNASNRFECRWVLLEAQKSACHWIGEGELWPMPAAHAEGRFMVRDPQRLESLSEAGQVVLRYVRADGGPAGYPECPNGSVAEIAGLCDRSGRVLGLMPHPERNVSPFHNPRWRRSPERQEGEGLQFFRRLVEAAEAARP